MSGYPWLVGRAVPGGVFHCVDTFMRLKSVNMWSWSSLCGRATVEGTTRGGPTDFVTLWSAPPGPICAHCLRRVRARTEHLQDVLNELEDHDTASRKGVAS